MNKYMPGADQADFSYVYGYGAAQLMAFVIKACGDDARLRQGRRRTRRSRGERQA